MPRSRKSEEPPKPGNFMTTFADMVTLLMAFFVLLFAMSTVDEAKFIVLLKGLEESFGNATLQSGILNGGESLVGANLDGGSAVPIPGGSLLLDSEDSILDNPPEVLEPSDPGDPPEGSVGEEDSKYLSRDELEAVRGALEARLEEQGLDDAVSFRFNERGLVVAIATDDVLFEPARATLSAASHEVLDLVADELKKFPNIVWVDGHTDDVPFVGVGYTNDDLSSDRAVAVKKYLMNEHQVPPTRLISAGYADIRPIADNSTSEGRAKNRRVELVISSGDSYSAGVDESQVEASSTAGP